MAEANLKSLLHKRMTGLHDVAGVVTDEIDRRVKVFERSSRQVAVFASGLLPKASDPAPNG